VRLVSDADAMRWLAGRTPDRDQADACGYDAEGWEATTWILHAMFENPDRPADATYDDAEKATSRRRVGRRWRRLRRAERVLDELMDATTVTGTPLGRTAWPGAGWRRLPWTELGERLGVDPLSSRPGPGSFPYRSWPLSIAPPGEGSLDREQFRRLVARLGARSPAGPDTACVAFYGLLLGNDLTPRLYTGRLAELAGLYDDEAVPGSPSNLWPADRSWLVYTDWDLWGTKVSGDASLIAALEADPELEIASLPF
jgi:hypothetical protein